MSEPRVIVLGGGPAGVGAARELVRQRRASVLLLEARDHVGGNAGSFEACGQWLDYGSHRLHPACDPRILADLRELLGGELLDRERHGRIRLLGRWIHFPLKPLDLVLRLPPRFALGTLGDMLRRRASADAAEPDTFASVLQANLGSTICEHFYFPYAVKIWGYPPELLSGIQARRRVSAGSFAKLARKVLGMAPGLKKPGAGRFFYPRRGYGQISEALADAARAGGADLRLGWRVVGLEPPSREGGPWRVTAERAGSSGERATFEAEQVWSTIPIPLLAQAMHPPAPREVLEAAAAIDYRSMILIYLELPLAQFTPFDAHYFPGSDTRITRFSEPKNYSGTDRPAGTTVLCAELACSPRDPWWSMADAELGQLVIEDLERAGLPLPAPPRSVFTRRLRQAYPIYLEGYQVPFGVLDRWMAGLPGLVSFGRQGLFTHDNTHHALYMAYSAVDCLRDGEFDKAAWEEHREIFATHVVED
jgi:protoporphyrinogen oxidase